MKFLQSFKFVFVAGLLFTSFLVGVFFEIFTETLKSNAREETLQFSRQVSATSKMTASLFSATPTLGASKSLIEKIELTNEDKVAIGALFSKILDRVAKDDFCSGGSYEVRPTYKYTEGARSIAGQELHSSLSCKITKEQIDAYNTLMHDLNVIVTESGYATLNIPSIDPIFSVEETKSNQDKLYKEILIKAQNYAKEYSQDLGLVCTVARLQFDNAMPMPLRSFKTPMNAAADMVAENASATPKSSIPIVTGREFTSNASVTFKCDKDKKYFIAF